MERLLINDIIHSNTVGEHSICSRNIKRADIESAPTANNVILIHTVGGDVLDAPLQRNVTFFHNPSPPTAELPLHKGALG